MVRHRVDGVDLVLAVEVGVEGVHHHDELLPLAGSRACRGGASGRRRLLGMPRRVGIDDEGAVHALVDVPLQRQGVAVVEVAAEREGVELVDELLAGADLAGARHAVHAGRVDAVEVHGVRVRAVVAEDDPHPLALGDAQARARHPAVVGPGREEEPGRDLDLLVLADDLERAQRAAIRQRRDRAGVPVGEERCGVEAVAGVVDLADGDHVAVRAVMAGWVRFVRLCRRPMAGIRALAGRRHAAEQGSAGRSEASPEKTASVKGLLKARCACLHRFRYCKAFAR